MLLYFLAIAAGLALLVWSADKFVMGASATAYNLGVPTLIIGIIIMGFGTSAPEIFVGAIAALQNNTGVAIGNAIGSNIANIALVLGIGALITPLTVSSQVLRREYPMLFGITIFVLLLMMDLELSRVDGLLLVLGSAAMTGWLMWLSFNSRNTDPLETEFDAEVPHDIGTQKALLWTFAALVILIGSSHLLVWGAVELAHSFGVNDLVIGLTIIAIGTSLPELAVTVSAALKKEHDIIVGNVIGSNMFNSLAVIGIACVIQPVELSELVLYRDYAVMFALTIAMFVMAYGFRGVGKINRIEATILVLCYMGYMGWLYQTEIAVA
ncbi:MAG: calcium:proton antiporter [Gammaproteobacteria bacterium SG8_11]|nr:MAG: calcium:proton antiporter [Gammaproteobacteria bacterium SG8_11]